MLRILIDHDLDQDILRGLLQRIRNLDYITAHGAGLSAASDPELLAWAANERRVTITHDRKTMPGHASQMMATGNDIAGVIIVSRKLSIRQAIDDLEMIVLCSEESEWRNVIRHLPL